MERFCPAGHELHCWPILTSGMLAISPQESRNTVKTKYIVFFVIKKYFCIELHSGERLRWFQCAEGPACLTMQQVTRSHKLLHGMIPDENFPLEL